MAELDERFGEEIILARQHAAKIEQEIPLGDSTDDGGLAEPQPFFDFLRISR